MCQQQKKRTQPPAAADVQHQTKRAHVERGGGLIGAGVADEHGAQAVVERDDAFGCVVFFFCWGQC
jgi:hypothetical protein